MHAQYRSLAWPVNTLDILLRQCYTSPVCQKLILRRSISSNGADLPVRDVAVLGGGITGLATAYFLSRQVPQTSVTLFEGSDRLGGWLQSEQVDVGDGKVYFEQGPRTLRPNIPDGIITLDLIQELGIEKEVLVTSKNSVAAQNRFIYYPDHLVPMPGPGQSVFRTFYNLFTEPVFKGMASGVYQELWKPRRPKGLKDESVGSFISRRFGPSLADNVVSAVFHGIYAGDIYQLSARSIMPYLWHSEGRDWSKEGSDPLESSVVVGMAQDMMQNVSKVLAHNADLINFYKKNTLPSTMREIALSSVYTFKRGIGQLANSLETELKKRSNVTIRKNTMIKTLELARTTDVTASSSQKIEQIKLTTTSTRPGSHTNRTAHTFTHVISTLPSKILASVISSPTNLHPLTLTPSVTVMVINLYYSNPSLLPIHGFGYLLPRSLPFHQNPERALGVVFDSDATIGQDSVSGTKVTVMMGGHWWDGWESYPDEEEGAAMAKTVLGRHLGIMEEPKAVRVGLQKECIPQYTVGHYERMGIVHKSLTEAFGGRLRVAGNSYTGVGLNDCVRAAMFVVLGLTTGTEVTGLDVFAEEEKWVKIQKKQKRNEE